jgi:hypothetical protein
MCTLLSFIFASFPFSLPFNAISPFLLFPSLVSSVVPIPGNRATEPVGEASQERGLEQAAVVALDDSTSTMPTHAPSSAADSMDNHPWDAAAEGADGAREWERSRE